MDITTPENYDTSIAPTFVHIPVLKSLETDSVTAALKGCKLQPMGVIGVDSGQMMIIDAAAAVGVVQHVVYTSFLGASPTATFTLARGHAATEEHLRASGMDWTFLRDSLYLDLLPEFAGADGVIRGPAGAGRVGAVLRADVARCAVAILADTVTGTRSHAGASYDLTGLEALTLTEIARIVTEETGHQITFHDETVDEAYASRATYGAEQWQLDAWVSTYTAIKAGELDVVTSAVADVTGTPARSLREHLRS